MLFEFRMDYRVEMEERFCKLRLNLWSTDMIRCNTFLTLILFNWDILLWVWVQWNFILYNIYSYMKSLKHMFKLMSNYFKILYHKVVNVQSFIARFVWNFEEEFFLMVLLTKRTFSWYFAFFVFIYLKFLEAICMLIYTNIYITSQT